MNDIELLDLISRQNAEDLLLQKNLTRRLNALAANGFIDIYEGKIIITPKGKKLQEERNLMLIEHSRIEKEMEEFSSNSFRLNTLYIYLCLILLFTAAVFLTLIVMEDL